jgi:hypothetical protein
MMKLMAYADGELEGAERLEAEMLIATDGSALGFVQQVGGLGELVGLGYATRAGKAVQTFDVADAVMAKLSALPEVSSLAAARDRREKRVPNNALRVGGGIAAALALAASVFLVTQHRNEETPMAVVAPPPATAAAGSNSGVAIESAGKSVSVFYLPTANELSTSVVVWVDETGEK